MSNNSLISFVIACFLAALLSLPGIAELQRRPFLGMAVQALSSDEREKLKLPDDEGLIVKKVFAQSSASEAGMVEGDIVLKLNGKPVCTPEQLIQMVKSCKPGEALAIDALRNSIPVRRTAPLKTFPEEVSADFDVIYDSVLVDGSLRRTIVTRPRKPGRYPALLLVGGIGCYSVDYPLDNKNPYKLLLYGLTARNFVTMRLEKSSMGDSQGPPCSGEDFQSQTRAYQEALKSLGDLGFVEKSKIFVFGYSIGGIIAPLLAQHFPLRGIVAAETVGVSWFEYELENARRQRELSGMPSEQIDGKLRLKELCLHDLLVEKKTPEQIISEHPDCRECVSYPASYKYMQQVADLNLPQAWNSVSCPVLVIYGKSDYVTSQREHTSIVNLVNAVHPEKGTLLLIAGMDHSLARARTMQASFKRQSSGQTGELNSALVPAVYSWLHKVCTQSDPHG